MMLTESSQNQQGHRHPRLHRPMSLAGRDDHFRAGRFTRGENFPQRISARECRRYRHRAGRTILGIFFEAAENHAVHDRIDVVDNHTGGRGVLRRMQFLVFAEAVGAKGAPAGEHFVKHEAQRIDVLIAP